MVTRPPANITNRSKSLMAEPLHVSGGMGGQPSISDRDPGDESRAGQPKSAGTSVFNVGSWAEAYPQERLELNARIAVLEAENAKLRADLAKWSRSQTVPEGSFW